MTTGLALVEAFNEWHWANNCFHDHVVHFALQHRDTLASTQGGEHSHAAHDLHRQFREQVEGFVTGFLDHHGATMEALAEALEEHQHSTDLLTKFSIEVVTEEVLSLLEYAAFHRTMLRALAEEQQQRPEAQAALQAMVDADVPEARAVVQAVALEQAEADDLYKQAVAQAEASAPACVDSTQAQRLLVTLPDGVAEGAQLVVSAPDGQALCVTVPIGVVPGQTFEVTYSPSVVST